MDTTAPLADTPRPTRNLRLSMRALLFISGFLALAIGATVVAMSLNARDIVIEQVERDVEVLARVLSQSISLSQQLPDQMDDALGMGMQATATALSHFVAAAEKAGQTPAQIKSSLREIVDNTMLAEIWVTDAKGRAALNAPLEGVDFTFSPDPKVQAQASAFWPLVLGHATLINQPMTPRELDQKLFKYVGVPGTDKPRIVQVGTSGESLEALRETVGIPRLARLLVNSGALKAIHVVKPDMTSLTADAATARGKSQLNGEQLQMLRQVMTAGKGKTLILPNHIEVYQGIKDEFNDPLGAFIVQLPRPGPHPSPRPH